MEWLLDIPLWFRLTSTFLLGTVVGSFLNVCILRLPWGASVLWPGSHCPSCEKPIAWYDNIPMVSWCLLLGRCRNCRAPISPRYAAVELLTGILFALLYWMEVPHQAQYVAGGPANTAANLHWRYVYHLFLLSAMIVATFIDLDYQVIPDSVTVPGMIVGLVGGLLIGEVHLVPAWIVPVAFSSAPPFIPPWFGDHRHLHGLIVSALGFVAGGGVVWLVRVIGGTILRKEAMGFGDVTLMAMIGSFVGWQPALIVFFLAPFVGMVVAIVQYLSRGDNLIPYGPYLSLATLGVLLAWAPIWTYISPVFSEGLIVPLVVLLCVLMLGVLLIGWRLIWWVAGVAVGRSHMGESEDDDDQDDGPAETPPDGAPPEPLDRQEPTPPAGETAPMSESAPFNPPTVSPDDGTSPSEEPSADRSPSASTARQIAGNASARRSCKGVPRRPRPSIRVRCSTGRMRDATLPRARRRGIGRTLRRLGSRPMGHSGSSNSHKRLRRRSAACSMGRCRCRRPIA